MIIPISAAELLVISGVLFVLEILFILHLQRTLERVRPENRAMVPAMVWLQIIPVFGFFWFLYVIQKVRDSLRKEYEARHWPHAGDFALSIGIAAGVLRVVAFWAGLLPLEYETMSWVILLGWVVCWFVYWVRTAGYKKRLGPPSWAMPGGGPSETRDPLCPVCGAGVKHYDRFCHVCGSRLPWDE